MLKLIDLDINPVLSNNPNMIVSSRIVLEGIIEKNEWHLVSKLANSMFKDVPLSSILEKDADDFIYGGAFLKYGVTTYIQKVVYSDPAVIVFWNDGTKTVSKCSEGDTFNKEFGLLLAVMKKLRSNEFVHKLISDWVPEDENVNCVTLGHVRKKHKKDLNK